MTTDTIDVLGVNVCATDLRRACETIDQWISNRQKQYVCVAPVSTIVDCQLDEEYKRIVNQAGMVTPDGMPLVWLGKWRKKDIQRTYGPDLTMYVCDRGQAKGYRHFFYGGTNEDNIKLRSILLAKFPHLQIAGDYAPHHLKNKEIESYKVIEKINELKPDIVWVGLGSPKQDYWMHLHREVLDAPVLIGIGAAFDFISGKKRQAPRWIQKTGLEWLFRLCCEPRRLWRRYLVGNSQFIYWLIKSKLSKTFSKR